MRDREQARVVLLRWHRWSVVLRAQAPDYDPHAVDALVDGFVEVFKALLRGELPAPRPLGGLFDAVEVLPLELMRGGPDPVVRWLEDDVRRLPALTPMLLSLRHRLRGGGRPRG